mmetsp:Transcript_40954/g.98046  ORF Transcript_40954/g.98046 Transcript_40954/m.98046 type:complete len:196 (-) Transcript_40954:61-648(-)
MNESLWFAYISALTVGLGDFFLQPEVMFIEDVFIWSGIMLFGFVELTLFLNKVRDIVQIFNPDAGRNLERRLAKTDFLSFKVFQYQEKNLKGIEEFQTLVQSMSQSMSGGQKSGLNVILRKKEVLISLLVETNEELKEFKIDAAAAQKERSIIEKENAVLQEVLKRTAEVRNTLEKDDLPLQPINLKNNDETKGV